MAVLDGYLTRRSGSNWVALTHSGCVQALDEIVAVRPVVSRSPSGGIIPAGWVVSDGVLKGECAVLGATEGVCSWCHERMEVDG